MIFNVKHVSFNLSIIKKQRAYPELHMLGFKAKRRHWRDPVGFIHHLPASGAFSGFQPSSAPAPSSWEAHSPGSSEMVTKMETAFSCQGPASLCSQHWCLLLGVRPLTSLWESRAWSKHGSTPPQSTGGGKEGGLGEGGLPRGCPTMSNSACARSWSSGVLWCCSRAWCPPCLMKSAAACERGEGRQLQCAT